MADCFSSIYFRSFSLAKFSNFSIRLPQLSSFIVEKKMICFLFAQKTNHNRSIRLRGDGKIVFQVIRECHKFATNVQIYPAFTLYLPTQIDDLKKTRFIDQRINGQNKTGITNLNSSEIELFQTQIQRTIHARAAYDTFR